MCHHRQSEESFAKMFPDVVSIRVESYAGRRKQVLVKPEAVYVCVTRHNLNRKKKSVQGQRQRSFFSLQLHK